MLNDYLRKMSSYLDDYKLISKISKDDYNVYLDVCGVRLLTLTLIADKILHLDSPLSIDESMRHSKSMVYDCDDIDEVLSDSKNVLVRFSKIVSNLHNLQSRNDNINGDIKSYEFKLGDVTLNYGVDSSTIFFFVRYADSMNLNERDLKIINVISECLGVRAELVSRSMNTNTSNSFH